MINKIKELRERTKVSLSLCKKALIETNESVEEAIVWLQKEGMLRRADRAKRKTEAGTVAGYVHHNGNIGVMVEVNCETEFSASSEPFKEFCENLVLHIASAAPEYLSVNDIPEDVLNKQREIFVAQVPKTVPADRVEHVINGKLKKWFADIVLVEQKSMTVNRKTVEQMRADLVQQIKENVVIKRFVRWELGDAKN